MHFYARKRANFFPTPSKKHNVEEGAEMDIYLKILYTPVLMILIFVYIVVPVLVFLHYNSEEIRKKNGLLRFLLSKLVSAFMERMTKKTTKEGEQDPACFQRGGYIKGDSHVAGNKGKKGEAEEANLEYSRRKQGKEDATKRTTKKPMKNKRGKKGH